MYISEADQQCRSQVTFHHRQFSLRPAFAVTINKAQRQTLEAVGVYLSDHVFSHGQLYVPLSRFTDPNNIRIAVHSGIIPGLSGKYTRNVVYRNALIL